MSKEDVERELLDKIVPEMAREYGITEEACRSLAEPYVRHVVQTTVELSSRLAAEWALTEMQKRGLLPPSHPSSTEESHPHP